MTELCILLGLVIFILVLCLISQLDDLCEMEKKIKEYESKTGDK